MLLCPPLTEILPKNSLMLMLKKGIHLCKIVHLFFNYFVVFYFFFCAGNDGTSERDGVLSFETATFDQIVAHNEKLVNLKNFDLFHFMVDSPNLKLLS